jgi:two-component system, LytTR family, response regulator
MIEMNGSNLIIETEKFIKTLKISEILFLKADGCYTEINTIKEDKIIITKTLKEIQAYFQDKHFCRCHKSYLINLQHFKELKKDNQERTAILINDMGIPVSQRKFLLFKECLKKYTLSIN